MSSKDNSERTLMEMSVAQLRRQLRLAWAHFSECLKALNGEGSEPCDLVTIDRVRDNCDDLELYYACKRIGDRRRLGLADDQGEDGDGDVYVESVLGSSDYLFRGLSDKDIADFINYIKNRHNPFVKAKYSSGDVVYFLDSENRICKDTIKSSCVGESGEISYTGEHHMLLEEDSLHPSVPELLDYLKRKEENGDGIFGKQ